MSALFEAAAEPEKASVFRFSGLGQVRSKRVCIKQLQLVMVVVASFGATGHFQKDGMMYRMK